MLCAEVLILLGREAAGQSDAREVFFCGRCGANALHDLFASFLTAVPAYYPEFRLVAKPSEERPLHGAGKRLAPA